MARFQSFASHFVLFGPRQPVSFHSRDVIGVPSYEKKEHIEIVLAIIIFSALFVTNDPEEKKSTQCFVVFCLVSAVFVTYGPHRKNVSNHKEVAELELQRRGSCRAQDPAVSGY